MLSLEHIPFPSAELFKQLLVRSSRRGNLAHRDIKMPCTENPRQELGFRREWHPRIVVLDLPRNVHALLESCKCCSEYQVAEIRPREQRGTRGEVVTVDSSVDFLAFEVLLDDDYI